MVNSEGDLGALYRSLQRGWYSEIDRLSENVGRRFWTGTDVKTTKRDVLLYPTPYDYEHWQALPIIVDPSNLPPLHGINVDTALRHIWPSVRSRCAQFGVDTEDRVAARFEPELRRHLADDGTLNKPFEARVLVCNRSHRFIKIPEGTGVFRFFRGWNLPHVGGQELEEMVARGNIQIEGKLGDDWKWVHGKLRQDGVIGIAVRIDPSSRRSIKPTPRFEAISIDNGGGSLDQRARIDAYLEPVPQTNHEILWVGETPRIKLEGVVGLIQKAIFPEDLTGQNLLHVLQYGKHGTHANSHLLDDGTDWPVRVEIWSATTPNRIPDFVPINFVRSKDPL
ncbi:MAG: hypothetical protein Q7S60_04815 [bacterium]|nr:hypothetical protein [bacterium]